MKMLSQQMEEAAYYRKVIGFQGEAGFRRFLQDGIVPSSVFGNFKSFCPMSEWSDRQVWLGVQIFSELHSAIWKKWVREFESWVEEHHVPGIKAELFVETPHGPKKVGDLTNFRQDNHAKIMATMTWNDKARIGQAVIDTIVYGGTVSFTPPPTQYQTERSKLNLRTAESILKSMIASCKTS